MGITKVYVIVAIYKGNQWYDRCFNSLRNTRIPIQTIAIDNFSADGSVQYIKSNYPEIQLIESDKNLGFGQANNLGIKVALNNCADYVFLLNQDAWVEENTIERLIQIHLKYIDYGIISPIHLNSEENSLEAGFRNYLTPQWGCNDFISDLYFDRILDIYETNFVNAAAWLISRKCLEKVGFFDPIFFQYGEDDNYLQRAQYHKFKIGIAPSVRIVHDTERRVISKVFIDNEIRKRLLVHFSDVRSNNYKEIPKVITHLWLKSIINLFSFKFRLARLNYLNGFFILSKVRSILKSIHTNRNVNYN